MYILFCFEFELCGFVAVWPPRSARLFHFLLTIYIIFCVPIESTKAQNGSEESSAAAMEEEVLFVYVTAVC